MQSIIKYISPDIPFYPYFYRDVSSTNTMLMEAGTLGCAEGTVILAESQKAGHGRQGRSFFSPGGSGLYLSLLLRPKFEDRYVPMITSAAAVAAAQAIEDISGRRSRIKWVNDIFIGEKKVCGILCEAANRPDGRLDFIVVGVGINVTAPEDGFPNELANSAGAVFIPGKEPPDARSRIGAAFLSHFFRFYRNMEAREYFSEYRSRCFILGRDINVLRGGEVSPAIALDINDNFHLLVQYPDGKTEYLNSGEVSIRPINPPTSGT